MGKSLVTTVMREMDRLESGISDIDPPDKDGWFRRIVPGLRPFGFADAVRKRIKTFVDAVDRMDEKIIRPVAEQLDRALKRAGVYDADDENAIVHCKYEISVFNQDKFISKEVYRHDNVRKWIDFHPSSWKVLHDRHPPDTKIKKMARDQWLAAANEWASVLRLVWRCGEQIVSEIELSRAHLDALEAVASRIEAESMTDLIVAVQEETMLILESVRAVRAEIEVWAESGLPTTGEHK